jgi:uncharacterized membrane protein YfcA
MIFPALIAISFSLGFFIESIIGFGGGLVAYAILGFFMDVKQMILSGLYIGTCSSAHIAISDRKSFSKKIFLKSLLIGIVGTIIGCFIFVKLDSKVILMLLGALSILLSTKIIFFDNIKFPEWFRKILLFIGGVSHGLFGVGGPFLVNALKDEFKNKSELRTTMACFFVLFNIIRFFQLLVQKSVSVGFFMDIWWVMLPIFFAIFLGHKCHLKISEALFKKFVAAMTMFSGAVFLLK